MSYRPVPTSPPWDLLGILLSGLCLVHCLALPMLLSLLPWGLASHPDESVHLALSLLAVPVGCLALIPGYRRHRRQEVLALGVLGLALLLVAPAFLPASLHASEQAVTGLGGALLVGSHLLNRRLARVCCLGCA